MPVQGIIVSFVFDGSFQSEGLSFAMSRNYATVDPVGNSVAANAARYWHYPRL
jgi:hypothetical protein